MKNTGEKMIKSYRSMFNEHGISPKSLGWIKGRQNTRFDALTKYIKNNSRILDFGCGFADLNDYLKIKGMNLIYSGCDVISEFIDIAKNKNKTCDIRLLKLGEVPAEEYDYIVCSGVFNFKYNKNEKTHQKKVYKIIEKLFEKTKKTLSIDFMSEFVDFKQDNSYHQSISQITKLVCKNLSRKMLIDHSYLDYEFCIHIFK